MNIIRALEILWSDPRSSVRECLSSDPKNFFLFIYIALPLSIGFLIYLSSTLFFTQEQFKGLLQLIYTEGLSIYYQNPVLGAEKQLEDISTSLLYQNIEGNLALSLLLFTLMFISFGIALNLYIYPFILSLMAKLFGGNAPLLHIKIASTLLYSLQIMGGFIFLLTYILGAIAANSIAAESGYGAMILSGFTRGAGVIYTLCIVWGIVTFILTHSEVQKFGRAKSTLSILMMTLSYQAFLIFIHIGIDWVLPLLN